MLESELIQSTSSWPFVEIRKLLKERKDIINKKNKIIFQTGYGPSGLPHIGTFGEVSRTSMMINALNHIKKIESELITFSDDMDGLRKVPENIPNEKILHDNLGKPLTNIPDPFKKYKSFGEHNNKKLIEFLNKFKFQFKFKSSTENYKKGVFNDSIIRVLEKYEDIMNIILPTLRSERRKTYSPFLPICVDTGKVLEIPVLEINKKNNKIIFNNNGKKIEVSILDGNCKLQWKVDWAMRWFAFDVDFEMYGKDLIESAIISGKVCEVLGKRPPNGFAYELFLDENGEKISKSKGNGITIEQWLRYASPESLSLYMYQNPKRAKKLYPEVVPKAVDEYLSYIEKYFMQKNNEKILNPVWHIHNGSPPKEKIVMPFSMLLNIVGSSNAKKKDVLWKFIKKFHQELDPKTHKILDSLTEYAINYFIDRVEPKKNFKKPNDIEKKALTNLINVLKKVSQDFPPEQIQTLIYTAGKENGYSKDLRAWFKLIYEVIFGEENGPRMGFFISFFGIKETIDLMEKKVENIILMFPFLRPFIFSLDPEKAHELAIKSLKYNIIPKSFFEVESEEILNTKLFGKNIKNPIGLAAGFDKSAEVYNQIFKIGFGFVEVGTITPRKQDGNPKPRVFRLEQDLALINRLGFNNDGSEIIEKRIENNIPDGLLGVNIGPNKDTDNMVEDFLDCAKTFFPLGDYLTINISSPNTKGLRDFHDKENLQKLLSSINKIRKESNFNKSFLLKISPDLDNSSIENIVQLSLQNNIDGLILTNTTDRNREDLLDEKRNEKGGLSGKPLRNLSTSFIKKFYSKLKGKIPIIGVGGVDSGETAFEKFAAGASAVQLYTGMIYRGPTIVKEIKKDLINILKEKGFKNIKDVIGSDLN